MMRHLSLATVGALVAGQAQAQRVPANELSPPPPTKMERELKKGEKAGQRDTRRVVQDFARCIARRDSGRVAKYLDSTTLRFKAVLGDRAEECLGASAGDESRLSGEADTFRYALAEAYLVRKYRDVGIGDIAAIAALTHLDEAGVPHGLGTLSECIIRKVPSESWALLRTDAASPAEKAAFAALAPAIGGCINRGTTVKMQPFFMRGAIAQTYYELSKAPRVAAGTVH
jgi:hypothetical protein